MKDCQAKLACTASGASFEEWRRRPVYTVHCKTFSIAQKLCGVNLTPGQGLAISASHGEYSGLATFRCLPAHRTPLGSSLRQAVAKEIHAQRAAQRLKAS